MSTDDHDLSDDLYKAPTVDPSPDAVTEEDKSGAADDIKQLGMVQAIKSLSYVFWIVGAMEMVERLAFYGVKASAGLYATNAVSTGALGMTATQYGTITGVWAGIQSFIPVFTGGLSDRYGYKETIAVSTFIKMGGYALMAFFPSYWGFMSGAIVLALGTAVFKPGIQGTLVNSTRPEASSMAWGIFYQTVNIGGFLGPLVSVFMRTRFGWKQVFFACIAIICCNLLLLLTYKEPKKEERLAKAKLVKEGKLTQDNLFVDSIKEIKKTHVWVYLLIFSGFWFMFNALFDVLPLHIRDWVNTETIIEDLFGGGHVNPVLGFLMGMNEAKTHIEPEGMLNLNAGLIMVSCFFFAWVSGKMRATTSMVVGTLLATTAMFMSGYSVLGWLSVGAIFTFSVGEMLSSPKFSEFVGNFAPEGKKGMYLGFSQLPLGIGWTLEGFLGPTLYDHFSSKDRFARELLVEKGMSQTDVDAIKGGEAFNKLVEFTGQNAHDLTAQLHATHNVGMMWTIMGAIGVLSAISIYMYGRWFRTLKK